MHNVRNFGRMVPGIVLALALAACGGQKPESAPSETGGAAQPAGGSSEGAGGTAVTADARAEAESIFASRCTPCHGASGAGDGAASAGLTPKPRNFQDAQWQSSVTDEHIEKIIQYGGAAVGRSPAMPGNPDLASKPAVVAALREHIRSLKK